METTPELDVLVIGAGVNGLYQLHRLREAGLRVRTLEAASGVGGTWFWNRYPGARLDSECYAYTYAFPQELVDGWDWTQEFADQEQLEGYFNYVADALSLRELIDFETRVTSSTWDDEGQMWQVVTEDGRHYTSRFLVAATGILSAPLLPEYAGIHEYQGEVHHTSRWPADGVDFTGKRVAVIGTGSTGIQVIQTIAKDVAELTVLQRTPNWATPINNVNISPDRQRQINGRAKQIYEATMATSGCFLEDTRAESTFDVSANERRRYFEQLYNEPGLTFYSKGFSDLFTDKAANDEVVKFLTEKILARVKDPETARRLIPDHGFGLKRPPLETDYYEVYNQANVQLVSLPEEPIVRFTSAGIETAGRQVDADIIVFATGFDAITGSFTRIGLQGRDGVRLDDYWDAGPRTYLGIFVAGFPNFFILGGPQGVNGNQPRCTTFAADWVADCIRYLTDNGHRTLEITQQAEKEWVDHCNELVQGTLLRDAQSWLWGSNVPGKKRAFTMYLGPQTEYRRMLTELARNAYEGIGLGPATEPAVVPSP